MARTRNVSRMRAGFLIAALGSGAPLLAGGVPFDDPVDLGLFPSARGLAAADIDGDGDLDLVGYATGAVVWYQRGDASFGDYTYRLANDYPADSTISSMRLGDLDRDGDLDVVTARRNANGESVLVEWLENDTPTAGTWPRRTIREWTTGITIDLARATGLAVADFDRDGDLDVAGGRTEEDVFGDSDGRIEWLESDGSPADGGWSAHLLEDWHDEESYESFVAADLDRDGDLDLALDADVTDGFSSHLLWYENDGSPAVGEWTRHTVAASIGLVGLDGCAAGDLDGDGDADLAVSSDQLYYYENDGTPGNGGWVRRTVADPTSSNALDIADFDRDGRLDLVVDRTWYENDGSPGNGPWIEHTLTASFNYHRVLADLDGDGDPDLADATLADSLEVVEDLEIHRSARFPNAEVVDSAVNEAFDVVAVDLDRDGDLDLVSASEADDRIVFHRNDGTPADGGWTNVSAAVGVDGARAVAAGDLDGDGDIDLVSAAYNEATVAWYESDGTPANGGWTTHAISNGAGGASDVALADFDGDGDLDVACAQYLDDEITWYRNNGGSPPTFSSFFVESAAFLSPRALAVADFDGDGDSDLAVTSEGSWLAWYENDGTPADGEWGAVAFGFGHGGKDVAAADLDRDGDFDVVGTDSADDRVYWFENSGFGSNWEFHSLLAGCDGARSVTVGDLDRDGDPDVVASCFDGDSLWRLDNDGTGAAGFAALPLASAINGPRSVVAADLDRDGDLDVAAVAGGSDEVVWYPNGGGQVAFDATVTAPALLWNDAEEDLFRITVRHRGRAGDGDLSLVALRLYFEEGAGDPLSEAQFDALVFGFEVYRDDGDLVFEPQQDLFVGAEVLPDLDGPGRYTFFFLDGAALARVAYGTPSTYFFTLLPRQPLGDAAPESFAAELVTQGAPDVICRAEDRDFDLLLDPEWVPIPLSAPISPVDVVFRDGFESGDDGEWSASAP
ncbi:MAG: VCBS repeat-containing protein [Thermoanaerobaculia bacterium]